MHVVILSCKPETHVGGTPPSPPASEAVVDALVLAEVPVPVLEPVLFVVVPVELLLAVVVPVLLFVPPGFEGLLLPLQPAIVEPAAVAAVKMMVTNERVFIARLLMSASYGANSNWAIDQSLYARLASV
jgi:hypothetical protein